MIENMPSCFPFGMPIDGYVPHMGNSEKSPGQTPNQTAIKLRANESVVPRPLARLEDTVSIQYSISASQPPNPCWMVPVKDYCYSYHIAILVALMKAKNAVHTPITRVSSAMTPPRIEFIDGPRATGDRTRGVLAAGLELKGRRYSKLDT
jgi:hypothetical protein